MKQFRLVDNILGWVAFLIAAFVYCSTIEPTASFWDCPEFIVTGYKLEIGPARCPLLHAHRQPVLPVRQRSESGSQNGEYDECPAISLMYPVPLLEHYPFGAQAHPEGLE